MNALVDEETTESRESPCSLPCWLQSSIHGFRYLIQMAVDNGPVSFLGIDGTLVLLICSWLINVCLRLSMDNRKNQPGTRPKLEQLLSSHSSVIVDRTNHYVLFPSNLCSTSSFSVFIRTTVHLSGSMWIHFLCQLYRTGGCCVQSLPYYPGPSETSRQL